MGGVEHDARRLAGVDGGHLHAGDGQGGGDRGGVGPQGARPVGQVEAGHGAGRPPARRDRGGIQAVVARMGLQPLHGGDRVLVRVHHGEVELAEVARVQVGPHAVVDGHPDIPAPGRLGGEPHDVLVPLVAEREPAAVQPDDRGARRGRVAHRAVDVERQLDRVPAVVDRLAVDHVVGHLDVVEHRVEVATAGVVGRPEHERGARRDAPGAVGRHDLAPRGLAAVERRARKLTAAHGEHADRRLDGTGGVGRRRLAVLDIARSRSSPPPGRPRRSPGRQG